jgi:hypothetical protein
LYCAQARFTFLYRKYNGRWLIAEHHSSAMPEQKPAGVEEMFDKWNAALQVTSETLSSGVLYECCRAVSGAQGFQYDSTMSFNKCLNV